MKNHIVLLFSVVLLAAATAFGQTATTSTTLSAAVSDASGQTIVVGSATNINAPSSSHSGSKLFVDREVMDVTAVNGTTISVVRGATGTVARPHASGATVYVGYASVQGYPDAFKMFPPLFGGCTAGNEPYLPMIYVGYGYSGYGSIGDCFNSVWQYDLNLPLYKFTVAPNAQRSAASPSAGNANSIVAQAGGASSNASNAGGAGGAATFNAGAGGAGASTGTAGAGGALNLASGAGGAAAGSGGVGGAGGAVTIAGGVSGGTITSGAGGAVAINGGASANGSTAAGNGGNVTLKGGNVGTGGTGVVGKVQVAGAVDPTKLFIFDPSGQGTGIATTFASVATAARTVTVPDVSVTIIPVMNHSATAVNASTLHIVRDTCAIGSTCAVTFTGAAVFADTNYVCTATDTTAAAAVKVAVGSASAVTFTGTGTDTVLYQCVGI